MTETLCTRCWCLIRVIVFNRIQWTFSVPEWTNINCVRWAALPYSSGQLVVISQLNTIDIDIIQRKLITHGVDSHQVSNWISKALCIYFSDEKIHKAEWNQFKIIISATTRRRHTFVVTHWFLRKNIYIIILNKYAKCRFFNFGLCHNNKSDKT